MPASIVRGQPTLDDVVGQDLGQQALRVGHGRVQGRLVHRRERAVGRREDRDVLGTVEGVAQAGRGRRRSRASRGRGCWRPRWRPDRRPCPLKLPAPVAGTAAQAGAERRVGHHRRDCRWRRRRPMRPRSGRRPWGQRWRRPTGPCWRPSWTQAAANAATRMRPAKAPVRVRLFIVLSCVAGPSCGRARGWVTPGATCPDDVVVGRSGHRHDDGVPAGGAVREGLGACRRSGCSPVASVARTSMVWLPGWGRPIRGPTGARCRSCRAPPRRGLAMARRRRGPRRDRCRGAAPRRRRRWRPCRGRPARTASGCRSGPSS